MQYTESQNSEYTHFLFNWCMANLSRLVLGYNILSMIFPSEGFQFKDQFKVSNFFVRTFVAAPEMLILNPQLSKKLKWNYLEKNKKKTRKLTVPSKIIEKNLTS